MPEPLRHQIINSQQCPRCGGTNTERLGSDESTTETWLCRDCQALDPDGENYCYDVCCVEIIEAVRWTDDYGAEHVIYDSPYLAQVEAMDLLAALEFCVTILSEDVRNAVSAGYAADHNIDEAIKRAHAVIASAKGEHHE